MADEEDAPPTEIGEDARRNDRRQPASETPTPAATVQGTTGDDSTGGVSLGWRAAAFLAVVASLVFLVAVVVARESERQSADTSSGATVSTAPVLAPRGSGAPAPGPSDSRPRPGSTLPLTTDAVATQLEKIAQRETGWTHKLSCSQSTGVVPGALIECLAVTEPPIDGVAPSRFVAVVLADGSHFVWVRGPPATLTIEAIRSLGADSCGQMRAGGTPYGVVYAAWVARGTPADLDPGGAGRPCEGTYPDTEIDAFFAAALPAAWVSSLGT